MNLLNKKDFADHRKRSPAWVTKMLAAGMPVEPTGLIDVEKAERWLAQRERNVQMRIPANTEQTGSSQAPRVAPEIPAMPQSAGGLSTQLLSAKVKREQAQAALTLVKVGERRGELGNIADGRAESRRAAETFRNTLIDAARADAIAVAGKFGLDQGEVQVFMLSLVRERLRRMSADARSEYERIEAAGA